MCAGKRILVYSFFTAWMAVTAGFPAHGQKPMFDVTISSPEAESVVGSPVLINVSIVNHTDKVLMFHLRMTPDRAGITVRDDHQLELEPRDEWRKEREMILRESGESADPSKSLKVTLNLAQWFDLSPGRYFVQLAPEGASFDGPRERQKSNLLEIKIASK